MIKTTIARSLHHGIAFELIELGRIVVIGLSGWCLECAFNLQSCKFDSDLVFFDGLGRGLLGLEGDEGEALAAFAPISELLHGDLHLDDLAEALHRVVNVVFTCVIRQRSQLNGERIVDRHSGFELLFLAFPRLQVLQVERLLLLATAICELHLRDGLHALPLLERLQLRLDLRDVLVHHLRLALLRTLPLVLLLEVLLLKLHLVVRVPHVLPLHRRQVHVLPQIVLGRADSKRLEFGLTLQVVLSDLALDDEGADFDLFLDLLLALVLDLGDHLLGLEGLHRLLVEVVRPLGEDLGLVTLVNSLEYL